MTTTVTTTSAEDQKIFAELDRLLESLRPILLDEGGDARLTEVRDGVARIAFGGGCEGCGGALANMEGGLRLMILERVPGLREVVFE